MRAIGETGLDYFRDRAPRADQRRAFEAQLDLAARLVLPVVIHTRAAEEDTFAMLAERAAERHRDPALLLGARPPGRVRGARLPVLVRRQRDLPEGDRPPGRRARACRRTCCWWRPTRPTSRPQPVRGKPNEPANVVQTARVRGRAARRRATTSSTPRCERERGHGCSAGEGGRGAAEPSLPRQASLNRLRRFGVRPNRELGQNFLVDDNLLGVIERAAELDPADVVLEVGGGLGVLSEYLAPRVRAPARGGDRPRAWSRRCATRSPVCPTRSCTWPTR